MKFLSNLFKAKEQPGAKYWIIRKLGQGSHGCVNEVMELATQKHYALKIQLKTRVSREHFHNEVEMHRRVQPHKNIVLLHSSFEDHTSFCMVMEMAESDLITAYSCTTPGVQESRAKEVMKQVLAAVHHCHKKRVLHRDIKPGNFLISTDGRVQLTDFGLAVPVERAKGKSGTPVYVAPEVLNGEPYGFSSDMYSVGVTMLELLLGASSETGVLVRNVQLNWRDCLRVSDPCYDLLRSLLSVNPGSRRSAKEALSHSWFATRT